LIVLALIGACASAPNFENLPPIAEGARELRIRTDYFIPHAPGAVTAYVVTPGKVTVHSFDGERWTSQDMQTAAGDEALTWAADLSDLDGRRIVCAFDGARTEVEGAIEGRRFSFVIEAADGCSTGDGRRVSELLRLVQRAGALRPDPSP